MTIEMPGWLQWLADITVGHFPEGDEDALRRMRDAYTAAAVSVREVGTDGDTAARRVGYAMEGDTATAFAAYWKRYTGAEDAYLPQLVQLCTELASSCDATALDVEFAKLSVIAALVALAAEVAALVASSFFDFGVSAAGIPVAEALTATAVRVVLMDLIKSIVMHVVINVAIDVGIQGIQMAEGNRHGLDVGKIAHDAKTGALTGLASFAGGHAVSGVGGHILGEEAGKLATVGVKGGLGVVAGAAEETFVTGVDQGRLPTLNELLRGSVQGGIGDAQEGLHERNTEAAQANAAAPPGRHLAPEGSEGPAVAGAPTPSHRSDAPPERPSQVPPRPDGPAHRAPGPGPEQNIPPETAGSPNRVEDAAPGEAPEPESATPIGVLNL